MCTPWPVLLVSESLKDVPLCYSHNHQAYASKAKPKKAAGPATLTPEHDDGGRRALKRTTPPSLPTGSPPPPYPAAGVSNPPPGQSVQPGEPPPLAREAGLGAGKGSGPADRPGGTRNLRCVPLSPTSLRPHLHMGAGLYRPRRTLSHRSGLRPSLYVPLAQGTY